MTAQCPQPDHFDPLNRLDIFLLRQSIFLSPQELNVLYWAKEGRNNREIADQLGTAILPIAQIKQIPTLLGEKDVIKALRQTILSAL